MPSQQQRLEATAFLYGKAGGWWGQLRANAVLILVLSLVYRWGLPRQVLDNRLPRHPAGILFAEKISLTVTQPLARFGLPQSCLQTRGRPVMSFEGRN